MELFEGRTKLADLPNDIACNTAESEHEAHETSKDFSGKRESHCLIDYHDVDDKASDMIPPHAYWAIDSGLLEVS